MSSVSDMLPKRPLDRLQNIPENPHHKTGLLVCISQPVKSARGLAQSKTCPLPQRSLRRAKLLDCASPLALCSAAVAISLVLLRPFGFPGVTNYSLILLLPREAALQLAHLVAEQRRFFKLKVVGGLEHLLL